MINQKKISNGCFATLKNAWFYLHILFFAHINVVEASIKNWEDNYNELALTISSQKETFHEIDESLQQRCEKFFYSILQNNQEEATKINPGFHIREFSNPFPFYCLYPNKDSLIGQGIYLINRSPELKPLIMAPHRFFDLYTDDIAIFLFFQGGFKALAMNDVHRYPLIQGNKRNKDSSNQDLARLIHSGLNAFVLAFNEQDSLSPIFQLHGYSRKGRITKIGKKSRIILSSGSHNQISSRIIQLQNRLDMNQFFYSAFVYGRGLYELGGTQNPAGILLRNKGSRQFIHVELSHEVRKAIIESETVANDFAKILKVNKW